MAKVGVLFFLLLLSLTSEGNVMTSNANGQRTWCMARPSSDQATLLANINYACSQVDCRILQRGCPCSTPDSLINHASIAMNLYFQAREETAGIVTSEALASSSSPIQVMGTAFMHEGGITNKSKIKRLLVSPICSY